MSSCLGLYIENHLIKYAKISKDNGTTKIEGFGIKFYDNLEEAIEQVVQETYSYKIPIAINLNEEVYHKFEVFSLLSKKDIDSVVTTEFENLCYDNDTNQNIYEQRHIVANTMVQNEKIKIIHVSAPKTVLVQNKNQFANYKLKAILPVGMTLPNLLKSAKKATSLIVNIEKDTTITKVFNDVLSDVQILPIGTKNIIDNINKKENSYSKAYEVCKSTTIYTENDKDLQYEDNEYLPDIMPTLYQIAAEVRKIIDESVEKIGKVYITGTAAVIGNIDIYFQDFLKDVQCEILKPNFIGNNSKINIKDYIEVNTAISLGLEGLRKLDEIKDINFTRESTAQKFKNIFQVTTSKTNDFSNHNFLETLNKYNRYYNILFYIFVLLTIFYFIGTFMVNKQLNNRIAYANQSITTTNQRIQKLQEYTTKFNQMTNNYEVLIRNIESLNDASSEDKRYRNTIPNLLNNIMAIIPKTVQLASIENPTDTHIVIVARSSRYEQIAFFKTKLKTEGILEKVVSDTGTMSGGYLTVTIEGELP